MRGEALLILPIAFPAPQIRRAQQEHLADGLLYNSGAYIHLIFDNCYLKEDQKVRTENKKYSTENKKCSTEHVDSVNTDDH